VSLPWRERIGACVKVRIDVSKACSVPVAYAIHTLFIVLSLSLLLHTHILLHLCHALPCMQVFEAEAQVEEVQAVRDLRVQARVARQEAEAMEVQVSERDRGGGG